MFLLRQGFSVVSTIIYGGLRARHSSAFPIRPNRNKRWKEPTTTPLRTLQTMKVLHPQPQPRLWYPTYDDKNNNNIDGNSNNDTKMTVLKRSKHGSLFTVESLQKITSPTHCRHLLPGEDPVQYECTLSLNDDARIDGLTTAGTISNSSLLCLHRFKLWWMKPSWVSAVSDVPTETIMLLWKETFHNRTAING